MERIILEVENGTAKKWRAASLQLRSKLNSYLNTQLDKILDNSKDIDSIRFFEELRTEMAEKGLTQEILDDILNGES